MNKTENHPNNGLEMPAERRRLLALTHPEWLERTISQHLDAMVERHADRPLVITDHKVYSYRDMADWSKRIAKGLIGLGVGPGDHVALIMANYPEFVAIKFAIARVGAVAVPINFLLRAGELRYILEQSDAKLLITMDSFGDRDYQADLDAIMPDWFESPGAPCFAKLQHVVVFPCSGEIRPGVLTLQQLQASGQSLPDSRLATLESLDLARTNADIIYTSGTTGSPKGVMLEHDMILRAAYASAYTIAFEDGRSLLFSLPMYHVFGYVECLIASTFVGGAIIPQLVFNPEWMVDAAERYAANEIICVPLMTMKILELVRVRGFHGAGLSTVFNSGGPTPDAMWQEIRDLLGANEIITAYGMSETTASTTCTFPEGDDVYLKTCNGKLKNAGVAGDPALEGVLAIYKTTDPLTGIDLPFGEQGELLVKGPIVTKGYYNKAEETRQAFTADGWLRTGDLGVVNADGYLKLTGRIKELYRCGGEMVMPREVEDLLNAHPKVQQSFVVGIPDPKMGEVGCACIIRADENWDGVEELQAICASNLARFKVPKHIVFVKEHDIPMTATGRPQKYKLVEKVIGMIAGE